MVTRTCRLVLWAASCLLGAGMVSAQIPQLIRYQGTLVDANNVPLEGTYTLTFRLYEATTGGTALWTETQTAIPISRGVFNVLLGQATPLNLTFEKDYWLSTQVGTDVEMTPRQRLTSVPYAYRAQVADHVQDQPPGFQADTGGTLTDGLVAYWKLEESGGTRDDQKGPHDLTDNNTVTQAAGKVGTAAQFTAANSEYLSIADNADLSAGDIPLAIAFWVYFDNTTGNPALVSKFDMGVENDREYVIYHEGGFRFDGRGGVTGFSIGGGGAAANGTWHFVVAWHDPVANTVNMEVNGGAQSFSAAHSAGINDTTARFVIGTHSGAPGNFLSGRIDEVGVWKKVLTAQERTDLYNAGQGNTYLNPSATTQASDPDISVRVRNSTDLSIPDYSNTPLTFNTEFFDTDNMHDPGSSTLIAKTPGKYFIYGHVAFHPNYTGNRGVLIRLNGSKVIAEARSPATREGAQMLSMEVMTHYNLAANDYVQLLAFQNSGAPLKVYGEEEFSPVFGMVKLP